MRTPQLELQSLIGSAITAWSFPSLFCWGSRVTKVREFQKLARMSEADGHLQQKLKQLLKLSKEKWDAACEHAKTAVQASAVLLDAASLPAMIPSPA